MKKILYILSAFVCLSLALTSCEALFDNLEGDLTKVSKEAMAASEPGIQSLLAQVYSYIPMNALGYEDQYTVNACDSHGGDYGFNSTAYYGMNGIHTFWNWGAIRTINNLIDIVEDAATKGTITANAAKTYIAEARFVRAYCYFVMVRNLGGVPIITESQDDLYDPDPSSPNEALFKNAQRATEQATWDFVLAEFQAAADDLGVEPAQEFRAGKYAALAMKARAALYAASVSKYWDKQGALDSKYTAVANKKTYMDDSMANGYYKQCIDACETIMNSGKFALYGAEPASVDDAVRNLGNMFISKANSEFIFGKSFNDGNAASGSDFDIYNSPAQTVTTNASCGKYSVTVNFVDKFDYYDADRHAVDGTIKTREDGNESFYFTSTSRMFPLQYKDIPFIEYDAIDEPFRNKDARFQAWILYPDCTFRNQTIKLQGGIIKTDGTVSLWQDASETVNGTTYYAFGDIPGNASGFFNYDNTMAGNTYTTGFGMRKFLDPGSFQLYHKTFWYDIRYAEILLSYAEAVIESKQGDAAKAKACLNAIRRRAGYLDEVDLTIENVLHQRELEFAFEGDWLYTLHRRRSFYNKSTDPAIEGHKIALTPMVDLRSGSPKYIFVRALHYAEDIKVKDYDTAARRYYGSISDYGTNGYEPNPVQQ